MKTTSIACVLLFLGLFFGSGCAYMDVSPVGDGDRVMTGKVTYLSRQSEYTPPIIYSKESRAKLVYLVEARTSTEDARRLRPGLPVDVSLGAAGAAR